MSESTSDAILRWRAAELRAAWEAGRDAAARVVTFFPPPSDDDIDALDVCERDLRIVTAIDAVTPPPNLPDTIDAKVRRDAQEKSNA